MDKELEEWFNLHRFHLYTGNYETKDLARYLGVSSRTIERWIKEKSLPSKEQLSQIRKYLTQERSKISL